MILLPVDEAYAMDYYAILLVKSDKGLQVNSDLARIGESIKRQIPDWLSVITSQEFRDLYHANSRTFDAVSKCKRSAAQMANRGRFLAKRKLQEKFWPCNGLTEQKTVEEGGTCNLASAGVKICL